MEAIRKCILYWPWVQSRDGPIRKFHYSAEVEYLMNAAEAEASAEFTFSLFLLISK